MPEETSTTLEQIAEIQAENVLLKRREQISVLLSNKGITDQDLRHHFLTFAEHGGELAEVDAAIDSFTAKLAAQRAEGFRAQSAPAPINVATEAERIVMLEAQIDAIRKTLPAVPPPTLDQQIAEAEKACDWPRSLKLKHEKSNQIQRDAFDGVKVATKNTPQLEELNKRIAVAEQAQDWKLSTDLKRQKSNLLLRCELQV